MTFSCGGTTTFGGGTAISGGGTPNKGGGTVLRPIPAEFDHCFSPFSAEKLKLPVFASAFTAMHTHMNSKSYSGFP